jgi:hypothetical protein
MLKINLNIVFIFLCTLVPCFHAQNSLPCGTDEVMASWFLENPNIEKEYLLRQRQEKIRDSIFSVCLASQKKITTATVYTVPIVFHILHQGGINNISDAQIIEQVDILNRDYRKLNSDTINIYSPFIPADVRFEFRLATKDTNGNCTTGITHHFDPNTYWTASPFKPSQYKYTWNSSRYLNVYVVTGLNIAAAAYSSIPGANPSYADVVVICNTYVGSIGMSEPNHARTLTHEVGHWFNLQHIWGNTAVESTCGDDGVSDTPLTKGFSACPSGTMAICNPTISENFQNYMDYSRWCRYMFSIGQAARMTAAINSTVSGRNNLPTNGNLIYTGVINPITPCSLIADANSASGNYTICAGKAIGFSDNSYNGAITTWNWSATGGATLSTPTSSVTDITFAIAGTQTVNLIVSNMTNTSVTTKTVLVLNGSANINSNYPESFEVAGLPQNFSIINTDGDVTWSQTSLAAATGTNSYFIDGSADPPASNPDLLETPSYDFQSDPTATFTFKYAYAKKNASNVDRFKVQASSDCGGTWQDIYAPSNSIMASASGGIDNVAFLPSASQFVTYTLTDHPNFTNFLSEPNVKIRFYFKEDTISGYGNNIFLDDINFNSSNSGINQFTRSMGFKMYPNPSFATVRVEFNLNDEKEIEYSITDVAGKSIFESKKVALRPGKQSFILNSESKYEPGFYMVNFTFGEQRVSRKLIIE